MSTSIYTKGFHGLQATSCRLEATGGRLQARGNRLQARSNRAARSFRLQARGYKQQATSYRVQATGYKHHVWGLLPGSFRYVGGLSESGDFQLHLLHRCCVLKLFFKICGIGKSQ